MITLLSDRPPPIPLPADSSSLELTLRSLRPILSDPNVTELCINGPGRRSSKPGGWQRCALPFADFDWCKRLAKLVANSTRQRVDEESPLLSASLPGGERIQIVLPPATTRGASPSRSEDPPTKSGASRTRPARNLSSRDAATAPRSTKTEQELLRLLEADDLEAFMRLGGEGAQEHRRVLVPREAARPPGPKRSSARSRARSASSPSRMRTSWCSIAIRTTSACTTARTIRASLA